MFKIEKIFAEKSFAIACMIIDQKRFNWRLINVLQTFSKCEATVYALAVQ